MSFLTVILERLQEQPAHPFLLEAREDGLIATTGRELRDSVERARAALREAGLRPGDRCAMLLPNGVPWVACNLALLAEGIVVVPLYARQQPSEIGRILGDCLPSLLICDDPTLAECLRWTDSEAPRTVTSGDLLAPRELPAEPAPAAAVEPGDPVALIYTSGTSGEPKGAKITRGNVDFMLARVSERLDELRTGAAADRVFHYLPWCFAGAWIALLGSLIRGCETAVNTDLSRLVEDLRLVRPHWFQNVPVVLDRVRQGIEQALERRGGLTAAFTAASLRAVRDRAEGRTPAAWDRIRLRVARRTIFPAVRRRISPRLRAMVCGSAPLDPDTQLFFEMLDIPVLQVYGLTETTAICTMDRPGHVRAGWVGPAVDGVEMRLGDGDEILTRGPHVFAGYWNRPEADAAAFADGWFRTGDRGERDDEGRWRILGRLKNLIVLSSGHNVAPEPIEGELARRLPGAAQIVLVGSGRSHLAAVMTGDVTREAAEAALTELNAALPHYQRIRGTVLREEPFTIESGLVTANGKLRRGAIEEALAGEVAQVYAAAEGAPA